MRFLITGDLVVNQEYDPEKNIDLQLVKLFESSDFNIVNLEAPVTQSENKIIKTGPHLKANKNSTLGVLKKLNINIVALANNHIKDYDEQGVLDTIDFCKNNDINIMGAGKNLKEASETKILNTIEGKIALINIAENEWSSAGENNAGANGMNFIKDIRKIQEARENYDFVFVIIHGGHEYYNLPSPRIREQYRFYIEQGADLVVGHHTHCMSGFEIYNGKPIYYSLGNFLFTKKNVNEEWYEGLVLGVEINNGILKSCLYPVKQTKENFSICLLQGSEKENVFIKINSLSQKIINDAILFKEWKEFTQSKSRMYLNYLSPVSFIRSKVISAILFKLKIKLINKVGLALYLNLIRCEAHSDVSKEILKDYLNK